MGRPLDAPSDDPSRRRRRRRRAGGRGAKAELLAPRAEIPEGYLVEALFDGPPDVGKERVCDLAHVGLDVSGSPLTPAGGGGRRERDGPVDRAEDVTEANVFGRPREAEAAAGSALRLDETCTLELLEDLLQESHGNPLPAGDVPDLRRLRARARPAHEEGKVEQRSDGIPSPVRKPQHGANVIVASEISRMTFRPRKTWTFRRPR